MTSPPWLAPPEPRRTEIRSRLGQLPDTVPPAEPEDDDRAPGGLFVLLGACVLAWIVVLAVWLWFRLTSP